MAERAELYAHPPPPGGGGGSIGRVLVPPRISTHASLTRGESNARRDLMALPVSSALLFRYVLMPARIHRLSFRTVR